MSTTQATLDSDRYHTDQSESEDKKESNFACPLCGTEVPKVRLSQHIADDCNSEHHEVKHDY